MLKKALVLGTSMCLLATQSFAVITADYAGTGTAIETEISSGLAVFMPIGGVVLAIGLAWKVGKRFVKG